MYFTISEIWSDRFLPYVHSLQCAIRKWLYKRLHFLVELQKQHPACEIIASWLLPLTLSFLCASVVWVPTFWAYNFHLISTIDWRECLLPADILYGHWYCLLYYKDCIVKLFLGVTLYHTSVYHSKYIGVYDTKAFQTWIFIIFPTCKTGSAASITSTPAATAKGLLQVTRNKEQFYAWLW